MLHVINDLHRYVILFDHKRISTDHLTQQVVDDEIHVRSKKNIYNVKIIQVHPCMLNNSHMCEIKKSSANNYKGRSRSNSQPITDLYLRAGAEHLAALVANKLE